MNFSCWECADDGCLGTMVSLLIGLLYASLQLPLDNRENKNSRNVCLSQIRENIFPRKFLLIQYFDDFLNGYSLAVTFADWLTGLVFHTVTQTFIALVSPSVHRNKVCIRDYTSTAFSTTTISRNFSARNCNLKPGFCGLNSCYGLRMTFILSLGRL